MESIYDSKRSLYARYRTLEQCVKKKFNEINKLHGKQGVDLLSRLIKEQKRKQER